MSAARDRQYERYGKSITNGEVVFEQLVKTSPISGVQQQILQDVCMKHGLSNRVHIKVIRLARTISDLDEEEVISDRAILEALKLRKVKIEVLPTVQGQVSTDYYG